MEWKLQKHRENMVFYEILPSLFENQLKNKDIHFDFCFFIYESYGINILEDNQSSKAIGRQLVCRSVYMVNKNIY